MTKPDFLFSLIKSMTKSEKRHFRLFSTLQGSGQKDYLRLFNVIEAQEIYDEDAVIREFSVEPYFKQLKSVKFYLYRQIIKSIKQLHDEASSNIKLHNYLIEIEILYRKELYINCAQLIKKAKAYALANDNFPMLLEIHSWEARFVNWNADKIEGFKGVWQHEENEALSLYKELSDLKALNYDLQAFHLRKGDAKTVAEVRYVESVLSHPALKNEKKSFFAELTRLSITGNCFLILGRQNERYEVSKRMIEYFELFPEQLEERFNEYFYNLWVLSTIAMQVKRYADTERYLQKLNSLYQTKRERLSDANRIFFLNAQIQFLLLQGRIKEANEMAPLIAINSDTEKLNVMYLLHLHELNLMLHFHTGDFRKAQFHAQYIINASQDVDMRLDMQTAARLVYLIIQYEQKEYQHFEYAWRSTYRYLLRKKRLQKAETIVLDFLRRANRRSTEKEIIAFLVEFREKLSPHLDELMMAVPLPEWIDSKLEHKNLEEVLKRNYHLSLTVSR